MNHRDIWFVGLLALAYLYLDGPAPPASIEEAGPSLSPHPDGPAPPAIAVATDACPRNLSHRISLRGDGAMWCLGCDEGFYPAGMVI